MRHLLLALVVPSIAVAQSMHTTHVSNGLDATSARIRIERGGLKPYGPRFEASGMTASPAMEFFSGLKLPGQREELRRPAPLIRVVKPAFRIPEQDLGIANVQDVIFFAEKRAVRFRCYLQGSGESLPQRWTAQIRKYFVFLDRDADGELNRYEAEFAFSANGVGQMIQSGFAFQRPDDAIQTFVDMDVDGDGKINFDEFAAFYAPAASRIISAISNPTRDFYADTLTDELFKLFDTDKDGRLSRAELNSVERLFATLDTDEDECLSPVELAPNVFNGRIAFPRPATNPQQNIMLAFRPGSAPNTLSQTFLARYDLDKNGSMSKAENPFSGEVFPALDKNRDGELTVTEMGAFADMPPDLELELKLAEKQEDSAITLRSSGKTNPLVEGFKSTGPGTAILTIGKQVVQLAAYAPRGVYNQPVRFAPFGFPDGGKGYLLEGDIAGPHFQALRVLFDMIDRDADGKMSRVEYDAFFTLQRSFTSLPLSLVYAAQTPSLFQFLDVNSDGRLSVRELRTSWDRLIAMETTEKSLVTRAALTPQGAIRFGRSNEVFSFNPVTMYTQTPNRQSTRGPAWFRKFDRNGDSELSRNEFPGSQAEFDKLDTNRDVLISVEEAEAADKQLRPKK
ncbi:MAG: hypothetical protein EXS09_08790 [Gemmataceae bacterium]|nr:hypothetical protein [Gemmataceae bacterium]